MMIIDPDRIFYFFLNQKYKQHIYIYYINKPKPSISLVGATIMVLS